MQIVSATSKGRIRDHNEDYHWYNSYCAVVCDGMGGHLAGEVASALAGEEVKQFQFQFHDPHSEIHAIIQQAHERIKQAAEETPAYEGMGTTLTMALFVPYPEAKSAYIGHVGDSRAYVLRAGQLTQVTRDHSVSEQLLRAGTISPEDAVHHPHRHMLTQALGVGTITADVIHHPLQPGDILLLCTDGLTNVVPESTIGTIMLSQSLQDAANALISAADAGGGPDNSTVILIQYGAPSQSGNNDR